MPESRAAIPADDKALDRPLGQLNAAEFILILNRPDIDKGALAILPDKKKYELWVDEGGLPKIPVGELIERLRREKKKLELEKFKFEIDLKRNVEDVIDPTRRFVDPRVIEDIARQVAESLRARG
ncbi:MAG TPA: hypothetical protein VKD28_01960 [Gemmatimonadales bacterium]|nr:hypothetical protein [Gemmatimonadales bacterium]